LFQRLKKEAISGDLGETITVNDIQTIFSNLDAIFQCSQTLMDRLAESDNIGQIFLDLVSLLFLLCFFF
jgi:hypothetical protein